MWLLPRATWSREGDPLQKLEETLIREFPECDDQYRAEKEDEQKTFKPHLSLGQFHAQVRISYFLFFMNAITTVSSNAH